MKWSWNLKDARHFVISAEGHSHDERRADKVAVD